MHYFAYSRSSNTRSQWLGRGSLAILGFPTLSYVFLQVPTFSSGFSLFCHQNLQFPEVFHYSGPRTFIFLRFFIILVPEPSFSSEISLFRLQNLHFPQEFHYSAASRAIGCKGTLSPVRVNRTFFDSELWCCNQFVDAIMALAGFKKILKATVTKNDLQEF